MEHIMEKAKELGALIKESEITKKLDELREKMDADVELQAALADFNSTREEMFNRMNSGEDNEEKSQALNEKLRKLYDEIMARSIMTDYEQAQNAFDQLMQQVNNTINFEVTGQDPSSCGGSCSTCGGCH